MLGWILHKKFACESNKKAWRTYYICISISINVKPYFPFRQLLRGVRFRRLDEQPTPPHRGQDHNRWGKPATIQFKFHQSKFSHIVHSTSTVAWVARLTWVRLPKLSFVFEPWESPRENTETPCAGYFFRFLDPNSNGFFHLTQANFKANWAKFCF